MLEHDVTRGERVGPGWRVMEACDIDISGQYDSYGGC